MSLQIDTNDFIGIPYRWGARGPDAYDCWGLVLHVMALYGRACPIDFGPASMREAVDIMTEQSRSKHWRRVEIPDVGDVAALHRGERVAHVGVYTNAGILHTMRASGCVLQRPRDLCRAGGYDHISYHRWVPWRVS